MAIGTQAEEETVMEPACLRDAMKKQCCHIPPAGVQIAVAPAPGLRGCWARTLGQDDRGKGNRQRQRRAVEPETRGGGDPQREGRALSARSGHSRDHWVM